MRKLLSSLVLFAAVGALVASASLAAPAQPNKKDEKKDTKKDDKKEAKKDDNPAEPGAIEVYQGKDGWRFRVTAGGKTVAIGMQGYAKKEECLAAVEALKATLAKAKVTEVAKD